MATHDHRNVTKGTVHRQIEIIVYAYGLTVQKFCIRVKNWGGFVVFRICEVTEPRQSRKLNMSLPECRPVAVSPDASARFVTTTASGVDGSAVGWTVFGTMMPACGTSARSNLFRQVFEASGPNITASSLPVGMRINVLFAQSRDHV